MTFKPLFSRCLYADDLSLQGYFHANRDRGLPYGLPPPPPPPFGMMYPHVPPRIRSHGGFHYDGPRGFNPRPNVYVRHGGMRGFGGRHMDGPRPRHFRDPPPHGFGPPMHNSFEPLGARRGGPMMNRESPSINDFVQQTPSTCDSTWPFLTFSYCKYVSK